MACAAISVTYARPHPDIGSAYHPVGVDEVGTFTFPFLAYVFYFN